jgi:hypothetical protein
MLYFDNPLGPLPNIPETDKVEDSLSERWTVGLKDLPLDSTNSTC